MAALGRVKESVWIPPVAALGRVKESSRVPPITRVCGGTLWNHLIPYNVNGLSPRVRGNLGTYRLT